MRSWLLVLLVLVLFGGVASHGETCSVQCYFAWPETGNAASAVILQTIQGAKRTLDIALSSFTDSRLGDAVVQAFRRGLSLRVILPKGGETEIGSQYGKLAAAKVPTVLAPTSALLYHRFAVVDGTIVITGSYAWTDRTNQATYDSIVLVRCPSGSNVRTTAEEFAREFDRLWERFGREETSTGPSATPSALVQVVIHEVDRAGQCIQLLNLSNAPVDISGWAIDDFEGRYVFPQDTKLVPNDPYRICSDTFNPGHDVHGLYLDPAHDELFLVTPDGQMVDEAVW